MAEAVVTMQARGSALLPRAIAGFIFEDVARMSAVQQVFPEQELPAEGLSIPVMTGTPVAAWVNEAGRKPISDATLGFKTMDPEKLAVIVPFSDEFTRTDRVNLFGMLRPKIAEAFALAFDWAAIMGANSVGGTPGTGTPFANFLFQTTNRIVLGTATAAAGGVYADLVGIINTLSNEATGPFRLTGWIFDEGAEGTLMLAVDTQGRPILTNTDRNAGGLASNIIGRPYAFTPTFVLYDPGGVNTPSQPAVGIGGDTRQAAWGRGIGIRYQISREATVFKADNTPLSAFQDNLVFLRAEAEFGWVINNVEAFSVVYPSGTNFA